MDCGNAYVYSAIRVIDNRHQTQSEIAMEYILEILQAFIWTARTQAGPAEP